MTIPFYVAPEQLVRDKAEFARKGIARGRSLVALDYAEGILMIAENPSSALRKISEMYDRIAFAGVGKYNEFETLRKAGIRQADLMGYLYSRDDVTAMGLATAFSQTLGMIFSITRFCPLGVMATSPLVPVDRTSLLFKSREIATPTELSELFLACRVSSSRCSLCPSA